MSERPHCPKHPNRYLVGGLCSSCDGDRAELIGEATEVLRAQLAQVMKEKAFWESEAKSANDQAARVIEDLDVVTNERDEARTLGAQGWVVAKSAQDKLATAIDALEWYAHRDYITLGSKARSRAREALDAIRATEMGTNRVCRELIEPSVIESYPECTCRWTDKDWDQTGRLTLAQLDLSCPQHGTEKR